MTSLRKPTGAAIRDFLAAQAPREFSYAAVGASRTEPPPGFDTDHNRVPLGQGPQVFDRACSALHRWAMFPRAWTEVHPFDAPIEAGRTVAVLFRIFGLWWLNACRIIYVLDEARPVRRFGFAYGTLPGHVECGEECFAVEQDEHGTVACLVRLAYPLARRQQRRFIRDSQAAMRRAVAGDR
jgi:uncharacterized protein (UPF0548 family)